MLASNNWGSVWISLFLFESARIPSTVALRPIGESLCAEACQFRRSTIVGVVVDVDAAVVLPGSHKMPPRRMVARTSAAADAVERVTVSVLCTGTCSRLPVVSVCLCVCVCVCMWVWVCGCV